MGQGSGWKSGGAPTSRGKKKAAGLGGASAQSGGVGGGSAGGGGGGSKGTGSAGTGGVIGGGGGSGNGGGGSSLPPQQNPADHVLRQQYLEAAADAREQYRDEFSETDAEKRRADIIDRIKGKWDDFSPEHQRAFHDAAEVVMSRWMDRDNAKVIHATDKLEKILEDGRLKSQFEAGDSAGAYVPTERASWEAAWFGYDADPPIYAAIELDGHRTYGREYGGTALILKPSVFDRITATVGDSLDSRSGIMPGRPNDDLHYYISTNYASVIDPNLSPKENADALWEQVLEHMEMWDYVEAQIHGGVLLSDIDRIEFEDPPTDRIKSKLAALGISWKVIGR